MCIYLVDIPEPEQYVIYALALLFDLRCSGGRYLKKFPSIFIIVLMSSILILSTTKTVITSHIMNLKMIKNEAYYAVHICATTNVTYFKNHKCDRICEKGSSTHIHFYDFEDP